MAVSPENHVARLYETGFQHHVLADAVVDVKDILDTLALCKFPDDLLVVGNLFRVGRSLKVKGVGDFIGIPDLCVFPHLFFKLEDAVGASEVTGRSQIHFAPDPLADLNFAAGSPFHNFHDCGFSHVLIPLFSLIPHVDIAFHDPPCGSVQVAA